MSNARFSIIPAKAIMDKSLTPAQKITLAAVGLFADKEGWCWPSQSTLADITGQSRITVNRHIADLVKAGYLKIEHRYKKTGGQTSNMYQVIMDFKPTDLAKYESGVSPGLQGVYQADDTGGVSPGRYTNTPSNTPEEKIAPDGAELSTHQKRTAAAIGRGIEGHRSIEEEVQRHLHIRLRDRNKTHRELAQFLKSRREEGQTVEAFAKWWRADWRGKDGAPPNPTQIMEFWPAAFAKKPAAKEHQYTEVWE